MKCTARTFFVVITLSIWCLAHVAKDNYLFAGGSAPPDEKTLLQFHTFENQIYDYVDRNHHLPDTAADVPQIVPADNDGRYDGLNQPFTYHKQPDGTVILSCIGKDGLNNACSYQFSILDMADTTEEKDHTFFHMYLLGFDTEMYVEAHHKSPGRLLDIDPVPLPGLEDDGWGVPLDYKPQADGSVIIESHGKPGSGQIFSLHILMPSAKPTGPTTATTQPVSGESK